MNCTKLTRCFFLVLALHVSSVHKSHAQNHPASSYRLIYGGNQVGAKNYYLLTLFSQLPEVKNLLTADPLLKKLGTEKRDSLKNALKTCDRDGQCIIRHLIFSPEEINRIAERLRALYTPSNALGKLVAEHLIPSGTYILFQDLPPQEMLANAWLQDARGINFAVSVYGEGKKPHYPNIDSISTYTRDPLDSSKYASYYVRFLYNTASVIAFEAPSKLLFSTIPLTAALLFLEMNEREQAADYEPMSKGQNKLAFDRIRTIQWGKYSYSLILVPGAGPELPGVALSAEAMLRCRLAAIQYRKGLAPFILTSGGKVHPYKTTYCEAIEMKKYLIEKLHIPAYAVLVDPHARHTTTNMRNTARIIFRYGIPFGKPAIACSTKGQSNMIGGPLPGRCMQELNETPYKIGNRLTETEIEFYPLINALQINPEEPMDP